MFYILLLLIICLYLLVGLVVGFTLSWVFDVKSSLKDYFYYSIFWLPDIFLWR